MKKLLLILFVLFLGSQTAYAVDYYSEGSLLVTDVNNWNTARDGSGTSPGSFGTGNTFIIQNTHSMTQAASWNVSTSGIVIIESGGQLTANSGSSWTMGTFTIYGGGIYLHNTGSATLPGTTKQWANSNNGGNGNGTVEISSSGTSALGAFTYGNLIINWTVDPGQAVGNSGNLNDVQGNFTVTNTQNREFRLSAGQLTTHNFLGDVTIGAFGILSIKSGTGAIAINIGGNFNNSGTFTQTNGTSTISFTGSSRTFTNTGTLTNTLMSWDVNSGASLALVNNFPVAASRSFTVNGILDCGTTLTTTGSGSTIISGTGTLRTGNSSGVSTSIGTTTKTFESGHNITWNGSSAQSMGLSGLTLTTPTTYTVSNTGGTVTADANVTFGNSSSLNINENATFDASTFTFTFGTTSTVTLNGYLITSNANGFNGAANTTFANTNSPTITLGTNNTIEYNRGSAQSLTPFSYRNLIISGAGTIATMSNDITVLGTFTLNSGSFSIGANTLTLNGPANFGGGTLVGGATSNLVIAAEGGDAPRAYIPVAEELCSELYNYFISSSRYEVLAKELGFHIESLKDEEVLIEIFELRINELYDEYILMTTDNLETIIGELIVEDGLNNFKVGRNVSMGSNLEVTGTLDLEQGLLVGANTLTLSGPINFSGGRIRGTNDGSGNSTSSIVINGSGAITGNAMFTGPSYFNNFSTNRTFTLGNNLFVRGELNVDNANITFSGRTLSLNGDVNFIGTGRITSNTTTSFLEILGAGNNFNLPDMTINRLILNRTGNVTLSGAILVSQRINLNQGSLLGGDNLTVSNFATIHKGEGSLTGGYNIPGKVKLNYLNRGVQTQTSDEIPKDVLKIDNITFNNTNGTTLNSDIYLFSQSPVVNGPVNVNGNTVLFVSREGQQVVYGPQGYFTGTLGELVFDVSMSSLRFNNVNLGGMGLTINSVKRGKGFILRRGFASFDNVNGGNSIYRFYEYTSPAEFNSGMNATIVFSYIDQDLNGNDESTLELFHSTDDGTTWLLVPGDQILNTETKTITVGGLNSIPALLTAKGDALLSPMADRDQKSENSGLSGESEELSGESLGLSGEGEITMPEQMPEEFGIMQNYPNPFNPVTQIRYALPENSFVNLRVYDMSGREVMSLVNGFKNPGFHTAQFDGNNLSSGVYFYRIDIKGETQDFSKIMRMLLVK